MIVSPKIFTTLDLEMAQPSGRIIQIGACVGDITTGEILESLSVIINPNETLSNYIINLTGITQEQVDSGVSLQEGYHRLALMHKKHGAFMNPITWGGGDSAILREQLGLSDTWVFGRRWIDAKTVYITLRIAKGEGIQSGLSKSLNKLGMQFEGSKHDAKFDAINTFRVYCKLLNLMRSNGND